MATKPVPEEARRLIEELEQNLRRDHYYGAAEAFKRYIEGEARTLDDAFGLDKATQPRRRAHAAGYRNSQGAEPAARLLRVSGARRVSNWRRDPLRWLAHWNELDAIEAEIKRWLPLSVWPLFLGAINAENKALSELRAKRVRGRPQKKHVVMFAIELRMIQSQLRTAGLPATLLDAALEGQGARAQHRGRRGACGSAEGGSQRLEESRAHGRRRTIADGNPDAARLCEEGPREAAAGSSSGEKTIGWALAAEGAKIELIFTSFSTGLVRANLWA